MDQTLSAKKVARYEEDGARPGPSRTLDPERPPRVDFDAGARATHAEACARFFGSPGSVRTESGV